MPQKTPAGTEGSLWRGVAQSVMRYPVPVLVGTLALLLVMALPLLRLAGSSQTLYIGGSGPPLLGGSQC